MKIRKKYCRYCGKAFYAKRIDAQYCSPSCRGMGNRAKMQRDLYSGSMLVQFTLDPEQYKILINRGVLRGITADEYVKKLVLRALDKKKNPFKH